MAATGRPGCQQDAPFARVAPHGTYNHRYREGLASGQRGRALHPTRARALASLRLGARSDRSWVPAMPLDGVQPIQPETYKKLKIKYLALEPKRL